MISLFIDTSSSYLSIAIIKDGEVINSIYECMPNKHSIYTISFIDKLIKDAHLNSDDINKIFVVNGPGSFTGLRIGITIAKVYGYLKNIPICLVSSLKARIFSVEHDNVMSVIYAKNDNYYVGLYDRDNNDLIKEGFYNKVDIISLINKYNPIIVSDSDIHDDEIVSSAVSHEYVKIINYYKDDVSSNVHLIVPNYLKEPMVLEKSND